MRRSTVFSLVFALMLVPVAGLCQTDDAGETTTADEPANFKYNTVTTKEGLTYSVPEDMPIVTRGGIQQPLPIDEYMYGKFKKMDDRLSRIEKKLEAIEKAVSKADPNAKKTDASKEAATNVMTSL